MSAVNAAAQVAQAQNAGARIEGGSELQALQLSQLELGARSESRDSDRQRSGLDERVVDSDGSVLADFRKHAVPGGDPRAAADAWYGGAADLWGQEREAAQTEREPVQHGRPMALEEARNAYGGVDAGGQSAPVCVVCMDANANLSFIHGNTAHMACCESCAHPFIYALSYFQGLAAGDTDDEDIPVTHTKCPLCRRDIDTIVKQF